MAKLFAELLVVYLDLPTLMFMGSFVAACAGLILLIAWSGNRDTPALATWGLANLLAGAGIFWLMLGLVFSEPLYSIAGGYLLLIAQGLVWKAARTFDAKPAPLVVALLGPAILVVASLVPGLQGVTGSIGLGLSAAYLFAAAATLAFGPDARLPARWPIIFFTVIHASVLSVGAYSVFGGAAVHNQIAPLLSLFGLVHFEGIVYFVSTAVFILAMVKERSEAASKLAAAIDSLTGIANRAAFMDAATRVLARCRLDKAPVSVIMFDLDGFKAINDTHGHAIGDIVIQSFCAVAAAALRPHDVFGRLGGEEFAVVLARSSIEPAYVRAERIRATFAENCRVIANRQVNATVSGGVSVSMNAETTLSELLAHADEALYGAKAAGRNRVKRTGQPASDGGGPAVIRVA